MRKICTLALALFAGLIFAQASFAQTSTSPQRPVYVDAHGVIRWRGNNEEVRLFGANYCAFSGSDYRTADRVTSDRKAMIDEDMAHFARMGWTGMRLCSWGDWENADADGNLIQNEHSDLMDYLISRARARGIYILLTPIHTYNPGWPDQQEASAHLPGFSHLYDRSVLGTDPHAIAAETNYISQVLNHVNPYTHTALKDEPNILFVEVINEPVHHPEDLQGSVRYINSMVDAVRRTGSQQVTFFNYTQDTRIGEAIRQSNVQGVTFGWYPSGLVAGRTLQGNFLQAVDSYPDLLKPEVTGRPRLVYEFDTADLITGYMYPAMARTYRSVGAQFASMFAYDMLESAPYNLGWQTHFLNLVHTPRKAVSAVIAAEAMRRLPAFQNYGRYPDDNRFGDFRVSYEENLSELNATDAFMNAGDTATRPLSPGTLRRIVGLGSSPLVNYEGTGAYFLDKVRAGVWRLELYPDEILAAEPFAQPQPGRVVSRLYARTWPMRIALPDLGAAFTATPVNVPEDARAAARRASNGVVAIEPGVWLLSRAQNVAPSSLPREINRVGFNEYHVNAPQTYPDLIQTLSPREYLAGASLELRVRVASAAAPDHVTLYIRPAGVGGFVRHVEMTRLRGYDYGATLAANDLAPGLYDYVVAEDAAGHSTTFPGAAAGAPGVWPFATNDAWHFTVVSPRTPLTLFDPGRDIGQMSYVRVEENIREPFFRVVPGEASGQAAFDLSLPALGEHTPQLYASALYVGDSIAARGAQAAEAQGVNVRLRALSGARKTLELFLIEKDGSSWRAPIVATGDWQTVRVPLSALTFSRSILIPSPFPGLWNYWRQGPQSRAGDHIHPQDVERLEFRVNRNVGDYASDDGAGVEIESVSLDYGAPH
ncbi:MAG: hypothetical protein ABUL42_00935 [Terricaulis silvestris]